MKMKQNTKIESRPHNSTYPQVAVKWLIEGTSFYSASVQADSIVLLNRHLWVAAKRYQQSPLYRQH